MNLLVITLPLLLLQTGLADKNTLPVFIVDEDQVMADISMEPNPFDKMSTSKFAKILYESEKRSSSVLIFIEDMFSIDDISLKDTQGSPYSYLHDSIQENKARYIPAVMEPYKILMKVFPPQKLNVFYLHSRTKFDLIASFKYVYIIFQEEARNETRSGALSRHDQVIRGLYSAVRQLKPGPVVAYYTGKVNPIEMETVRFVQIKPVPPGKTTGVIMIASSGGLFLFSDVYAASPIRRSTFNQLPIIAEESWSRRGMSTKMAYTDFELQFNFSFLRDRWILDNVALLEAGEEVGRTKMGVGAPWNMSYVCGDPLTIINCRDGSAVTISQYQIQPRIVDVGGVATASNTISNNFGTSVNCGRFFNIGIMSALFVTSLLMVILTYGIVSIMDIKANDRYEDPQSKPLVHTEN